MRPFPVKSSLVLESWAAFFAPTSVRLILPHAFSDYQALPVLFHGSRHEPGVVVATNLEMRRQ